MTSHISSNHQNQILKAVADLQLLATPGEGLRSTEIAQHAGLEEGQVLRTVLHLMELDRLTGRSLRGDDGVASAAGIRLTEHGRQALEQMDG